MTLTAANYFPVNSLWTDGREVAVTGGAVAVDALLPPPEILEHSARWLRFLWGDQGVLKKQKQIGNLN